MRRGTKTFFQDLTATFTGGCFGGLINGLAVWLFGVAKITGALGVHLAPALTPDFIYPRIVWGGLWGFLFLLPKPRRGHVFRGLIFSLAPSLVQLLVVFPFKSGGNWLGLKLGYLTPLLVLFFNALWGAAAGIWLTMVKEN
jgi:hypothetical protein